MRKAITLRAFPRHMDTLSRVRLARDAGFDGVEINLEAAGEFTLESSPQTLRALRREIEALGMCVSSVYSRQQWHHPITSERAETRSRGKEIILTLARAAGDLGSEAVLVVPGAVDNSFFTSDPEFVRYDHAYERGLAIMQEIAAGLQPEQGVFLAIENVWNKFLLSPLEFARFIDEIDHPMVGAYFDVGNVLRIGFPEHWIHILGHRIRRVHFKDFRLAVDNAHGFVTLLEGDVNWPAVRAALHDIGYSSWVAAEVLPAYRYHGEQLIYETSRKVDAILGGRTGG